jgi:hypothetical protein
MDATEYLLKESKVILWCACCDAKQKELVTITDVTYSHTGYEDFYELTITGTNADGATVNKAIDLAYVHVKIGNDAKCLGKVLDM